MMPYRIVFPVFRFFLQFLFLPSQIFLVKLLIGLYLLWSTLPTIYLLLVLPRPIIVLHNLVVAIHAWVIPPEFQIVIIRIRKTAIKISVAHIIYCLQIS